MRVHVAYVEPGLELCVAVDVHEGASVDDAVRTSGVAERIAIPADSRAYAIFGKSVGRDTLLAEGDRVDITRPLLCDPKTARRRRAAVAFDQDGAPRERSAATRPTNARPATAVKVEDDRKP